MNEAEPSQTPETVAPVQESVPETKNEQNAPATVEGKGDQSAAAEVGSSRSDLPKGVKRDIYDLRKRNREQKEKMLAMEQELETLRSRRPDGAAPNNATQASQPTSIFDNPEQYLAGKEQELMQRMDKMLSERLGAREQHARLQNESQAAETWLLAQKDLKDDPDAKEEIEEMLSTSEELQAIGRISPRRAAQLVYSEWRERKGLDRAGAQASTARAKGVGPAASNGSGPKIWTAAEAESYQNSAPMGSPERNRRFQEVLQAQREGRIK